MSLQMIKKPKDRKRQALFPEITPYASGYLNVDDTHSLYWEICGNPEGIPVVLFHGGPGAGTTPTHRRFFDPEFYKIILFDQRGAGRSSPLGSLENNTLEHLVSDTETLRKHLRIEKWHLFGGSWGATLAIAYAKKYPNKCLSLTLRGIFLCEQSEIDWFMYGIRTVFPENWERFASFIPEDERDDLLIAYYSRLTSDDKELRQQAGMEWALYESGSMSFHPRREAFSHQDDIDSAVALARLEAHYFLYGVISEENSLLNNIDKLKKIPCTVIQGRYDMICPVITAEKFHKAWPEADYIIVPDGGHSAMDPSICARLVEAMENTKLLTS